MSSARRLQDDYRRILGITEDARGLDDSLPRMRIEGQRGIFQIGSGEMKSGSAGGEDEDGNPKSPITPDENQDNQNSDGSGQGGSGTDSGATDGSDFEINPDDAPPGVDINDSTFGDGWATGGIVTLQDCETEQCIELVEVGGYVPPDGWDGADNPPIEEGYQAGFYWSVTVPGGGARLGQTPCAALGKVYPYQQTTVVVYTVTLKSCTPNFSNNTIAVVERWTPASGSPPHIQPFDQSKTAVMSKLSCGANPPINADCGLPPPGPSHWPADNCIQLAPNAQGNWQASPRENPADMTAKYSEAKSTLNLCNSAGESIEINPRRGGGYVYFNADQGIWAASDASGRKRSFGSSSTLNQEIARG